MTDTVLIHHLGQALALQPEGAELPRWRYVYSGKPKPYIHPLCTPAGACLTLFEPHDHVWHRGLWFTIKYINGDNFWEEGDPCGIQHTLTPPTVSHDPSGAMTLESALHWQPPAAHAPPVIHEQRRIVYRPLSADAYALDFDLALTAQADLLLDRTPFTTWGGYGGLILRGNRNWQATRLLFPDGSTSDRPTGVRATWCDLAGVLDGGPNLSGGVAIFDHPANPRHPSPWYGSTGSGHYFNAAFLFHEPMQLAAGETLRLRYRVLVHDALWDVPRLEAAYRQYVTSSSS
ncbi:PmoA family protein [Kallotenue papyrolyticum]|uniref:DUF6807 domain-containing protein n=1 Tax=Kallotenue papyrolyticum TaxID=1325125 RepID=UPI00046FD78D|nr:PmoA family protein [Kallotenue papyrolyticum]